MIIIIWIITIFFSFFAYGLMCSWLSSLACKYKTKGRRMIYLLICMFMTPVLFPLVIIIVRIVEVKRDPFIHIRGKVNLARDWEIGEEQKRAIRLYRSALGELEKRFGQDLRTDPSESDDKKIAETRYLFEELTRKTQLFDRGKKGEGVLINAKGKTRIEFEYEIDGRKYTAEVKKPFGLLENGEIYEILYLPENPLNGTPDVL